MGFKILTEREKDIYNAKMLHGNLRLTYILHFGENHKQKNYKHFNYGVDALVGMKKVFEQGYDDPRTTKVEASVEVFDFNVWEKNGVSWIVGKFENDDQFIDLLDQVEEFYKAKEEPIIEKADIINFLLISNFIPQVDGVKMIQHEK